MSVYSPLMRPGLLPRRLQSGKARIDPELGLEKLCSGCGEYWPQDTQFWSARHSAAAVDGLQHYCKSCESERAACRRAAQQGAA